MQPSLYFPFIHTYGLMLAIGFYAGWYIAARLGQPGDKLIIFAFCLLDDEAARMHRPTFVHVDDRNRIRR